MKVWIAGAAAVALLMLAIGLAKPAFWALRDVLEREPGRAILTPN